MNLKQFVKIHPFRFALFVLGSIVVPAIAIFSNYLAQTLTNVILARNWHEFILIAIVCFIIMLILYFLLPIVQNLDNYLQQDLNQQVRAKIVKHYYDDQKQHTVADMQNRLTNDLTLINENYFTNLFGVIYGTVLIISVVIYLILLSWQLLIVICIMVAVSLLLPKLTEKPLQKANQMISDSNQAYLDTLNDWLSGLEQIRQFMVGVKLFSITANASKKLEDANVKQTGYIKLLEAVNGIVSALFGLILFILAGVLVKQGSITIGALMIVGNFRFYLSQGINMVTSGRGAMKGTTKLIDEVDQSASKVEVPKEKQGVVPASIETHDLKLQFPNGEKLAFADLQIKQGEKILLTGDSGAGKSTLFKLILGELKPSEGNVVYKDQNGKEIIPLVIKKTLKDQTTDRYKYTVVKNDDLAFDHALVIATGISRLKNKVGYTDIVFNMMPEYFTLGELQQVYEVILGKKLLDPAFRRIIANKVEKTKKVRNTGGHRPSYLFKYKVNKK